MLYCNEKYGKVYARYIVELKHVCLKITLGFIYILETKHFIYRC